MKGDNDMNLTNIINKELTWYKDIDVELCTETQLLCFTDKRTGAFYAPLTSEGVLRMFKEIGILRSAMGTL